MVNRYILVGIGLIMLVVLSGCSNSVNHITYRDIIECREGKYNTTDIGFDEGWFMMYGKYPKALKLVSDDGVCKWYIDGKHIFDCQYGLERVKWVFGNDINNIDVPLYRMDKYLVNIRLSNYVGEFCRVSDEYAIDVAEYQAKQWLTG